MANESDHLVARQGAINSATIALLLASEFASNSELIPIKNSLTSCISRLERMNDINAINHEINRVRLLSSNLLTATGVNNSPISIIIAESFFTAPTPKSKFDQKIARIRAACENIRNSNHDASKLSDVERNIETLLAEKQLILDEIDRSLKKIPTISKSEFHHYFGQLNRVDRKMDNLEEKTKNLLFISYEAERNLYRNLITELEARTAVIDQCLNGTGNNDDIVTLHRLSDSHELFENHEIISEIDQLSTDIINLQSQLETYPDIPDLNTVNLEKMNDAFEKYISKENEISTEILREFQKIEDQIHDIDSNLRKHHHIQQSVINFSRKHKGLTELASEQADNLAESASGTGDTTVVAIGIMETAKSTVEAGAEVIAPGVDAIAHGMEALPLIGDFLRSLNFLYDSVKSIGGEDKDRYTNFGISVIAMLASITAGTLGTLFMAGTLASVVAMPVILASIVVGVYSARVIRDSISLYANRSEFNENLKSIDAYTIDYGKIKNTLKIQREELKNILDDPHFLKNEIISLRFQIDETRTKLRNAEFQMTKCEVRNDHLEHEKKILRGHIGMGVLATIGVSLILASAVVASGGIVLGALTAIAVAPIVIASVGRGISRFREQKHHAEIAKLEPAHPTKIAESSAFIYHKIEENNANSFARPAERIADFIENERTTSMAKGHEVFKEDAALANKSNVQTVDSEDQNVSDEDNTKRRLG